MLVEYQDWHTPLSDDDDELSLGDDELSLGRRDHDSYSGDNNYNGYWPDFSDSGSTSPQSCTTRDGGTTFRPRQASNDIIVGQFGYPDASVHDAVPFSRGVCGFRPCLVPCPIFFIHPIESLDTCKKH